MIVSCQRAVHCMRVCVRGCAIAYSVGMRRLSYQEHNLRGRAHGCAYTFACPDVCAPHLVA
eukprot:817686-Pleurochrysis_carterae.AAC.1